MTAPSLLDELEGVVRQLHEVDGKEGLVLEKMRMLSTAGLFIKAHHAEIADMAKRLEAAERDAADARRYRFIAAEHGVAWEEDLDAAIDTAINGYAHD